MSTIAGVVLTLNEEKDLARALSSLDWCDELLVVDSGSKDQTQNVAENCGARFVRHCQTPPFLITEQRNWALDNAGLRSEWVLFLDADEEVRDELAARIKSCIASTDLTDAYEGHSGVYRDARHESAKGTTILAETVIELLESRSWLQQN